MGASLKVEYLHTAVAVGSPCESRVRTQCSCYWRPLQKQISLFTHYKKCWGLFESIALTYDLLQSILYESIISFSPKLKEIYRRNTTRMAPKKRGGARQVPRLPPLKHTTAYNNPCRFCITSQGT